MKPISTRTHGIIDYISVATLLALPRLLDWEPEATTLLTGSALGTAGYSALTDYELSAARLIPMKAHLALDVMQGLLLGAAPFLLLKDLRRSTVAGLLGISIFEALVVMNTETE